MFFLPYQRRWIRDMSRIKVMEKARQVGMSWTAAYRAVRNTAVSWQRLDTWIASRDEVQARLFLDDCRRWAGILAVACDPGSVLPATSPAGAGSLHFANGRAIHCVSSSADAQAGKRGTRILDEFALHTDPRQLYAIAYPGITWGGQLEIISTHRGSHNFFNHLVREARDNGNPKHISLHHITLQDALAEGLLARLQAKLPPDDPRATMDTDSYLQHVRDGCPDQETWLQEYCCVPADDATAFLPLELIEGAAYAVCESGNVGMCEGGQQPSTSEFSVNPQPPWRLSLPELRRASNPLYLGVDVGRDHDLTVLWLVELCDGVLHTRRLDCLKAMPFSAQEDRLYELLSLPTLRRCAIDATGMGRQFAERAQQRHGFHRVEAITLSAPVKEELAYPVRAALENATLRIPPEPQVRADLRAIRKETTAAGTLRFTADRGKNGHADRFWALALCLHAARHHQQHHQLHAEALGGRHGGLF